MKKRFTKLKDALAAFDDDLQAWLEPRRTLFQIAQLRGTPNPVEQSKVAGGIQGAVTYDRLLSIVADYKFMAKEDLEQHLNDDFTDAEFDRYIVDNADQFLSQDVLPDRPEELPRLIASFEKATKASMKDKAYMRDLFALVAEEVPDLNRDAFIEGMNEFMTWVKKDEVPALVPVAKAAKLPSKASAIVIPRFNLAA